MSKYKHENLDDNGWMEFLKLCSKIQSPQDFQRLFDLFLTLEEKKNIASRYLIVKALVQGRLTQRAIAETHKVSIAQITRGSNALKIIDDKLQKFLKQNIE